MRRREQFNITFRQRWKDSPQICCELLKNIAKFLEVGCVCVCVCVHLGAGKGVVRVWTHDIFNNIIMTDIKGNFMY